MAKEIWKPEFLNKSLIVNFKGEGIIILTFKEKDEDRREILFTQARITIDNDEPNSCNRTDDVKIDQREKVNAETSAQLYQTRKWEWDDSYQKNQDESIEII